MNRDSTYTTIPDHDGKKVKEIVNEKVLVHL